MGWGRSQKPRKSVERLRIQCCSGENDEVGRQNTVLSKLSNTLRKLLSTFWTGSLGRNPGSVGNFQVESWRGSCEEPLWLVHKWDWNMEEGQGPGGHKCN